ncbi:MAG: hypothetical protein ACE5HX_15730 [bacterium]
MKDKTMNKFDEYKFFAESTQYLSDKRHTATQTYLSVNSAIFAVLAFLVKEGGFASWKLLLTCAPLFVVGILACWLWYKLITQYKSLINWRYEQLMQMEKTMPDCFQMYIKEWQEFFKPQQGRDKFGFSRLEVWLPRLFLGLYILFGMGLIIAMILNWGKGVAL